LIRRLKGRPQVSDLFGKKGRAWLAELELPIEERETLDSGLRQIDFLDAEVASVDRVLAHDALNWPEARRLMTAPGVNLIAAATFLAAVGNIERFPDRRKLVAYLGLDPKVRQSGDAPAAHGHISKQGAAAVRVALVEASCSAVRNPGPLRALYQRVRARCGHQVAITATARKLACLFWILLWRQQDYAFGQPSLTAKKLRRWRSPPTHPAGKTATASGSPTACSATPNSTSPAKPNTHTPRPSATAKPPARSRRARARRACGRSRLWPGGLPQRVSVIAPDDSRTGS
jgi:hypothetical protein